MKYFLGASVYSALLKVSLVSYLLAFSYPELIVFRSCSILSSKRVSFFSTLSTVFCLEFKVLRMGGCCSVEKALFLWRERFLLDSNRLIESSKGLVKGRFLLNIITFLILKMEKYGWSYAAAIEIRYSGEVLSILMMRSDTRGLRVSSIFFKVGSTCSYFMLSLAIA